jgi:hypothetical protein
VSKFTPRGIFASYASEAALNANFADIQTLLEKCVFRDGTAPNSMSADFDLNHYKLLNLADATLPTDAVPYGQMASEFLTITQGPAGPDTQTVLDELVSSTGSGLVGFTNKGPSVTRTIQDKGRDTVSVKDFGAVGDGVTNDNNALELAFQYAADSGDALYVPDGTYLVDRGVGYLTSIPSGRFVLHGNGASSVLKMSDGGITSDFAKIFSFQPTDDVELIEIGSLTLDMNARGSAAPAGDFDYQHCHAISVEPQIAVTVGHCRFPGLIIKDPVADGINIAPNVLATIDTVQINDFLEIDRTRTRSSIECSNLPNSLVITGARCSRIETETLNPSTTTKRILISNCHVDVLDLLEDLTAVPTMVETTLSGVVVANAADIYNMRVMASNCKFRLATSGTFGYLYKSEFTGCTFLHPYDSGAGSIQSFNPFWRSTNANVVIEFNSCKFLIDSDNEAITPTGYLVAPSHTPAPADVDKFRLTFNNCKFDKRAQGSINALRNGTWFLNHNHYGGTTTAVQVGVTVGFASDVTINGGNFRDVTGSAVRGVWLAVDQVTTLAYLRMFGDWIGVTTPVSTASGSTADTDNWLRNARRMVMTALPAGGLKGDILELTSPAAGSADSYRCTASSASAATWKIRTTLGA